MAQHEFEVLVDSEFHIFLNLKNIKHNFQVVLQVVVPLFFCHTVGTRLEKAAHGGFKGCSHCAYLRMKMIAKMLDSANEGVQPTILME